MLFVSVDLVVACSLVVDGGGVAVASGEEGLDGILVEKGYRIPRLTVAPCSAL